MQTIIKLNRSLRNVITYHEKKVTEGQAQCLVSGNFLKDTEQLSLDDKFFHFQRRNDLNDNVARKTIHIFLSFHRKDRIDSEKMKIVVQQYMQEMGLSRQPYLFYRHFDTLNPHGHIVVTNIQQNGVKLHIQKKDYFRSNQIAQQLDRKYALTPTGARLPDDEWARLHPPQKVIYGKTPIHSTIETVLNKVIPVYKYTSIEELNAILRPYNISASLGREGSSIRRHGGLVYITQDGENTRGSYIKASRLKNKPTLKHLQKRFVQNQALREPHRQRLTTAIDWAFYKKELSLEAFGHALEKENIGLVIQDDTKGRLQNIWYLDHQRQTVFDGKTLGDGYNAADIRRRVIPEKTYQQHQKLEAKQTLRPRRGLHQ